MEAKTYRGDAGQVVRGFLSLGTAFTCVPVVIATFAIVATIAWIGTRFEMPDLLVSSALVVALSPLVGLFALSARAGSSDAGFFESMTGPGMHALPGFCLRYSALTLGVHVPLALAATALVKQAPMALMGGPGSGQLVGFLWLGTALCAAYLALPCLTLLIATRTDSMGEAFSTSAWRWLLGERRSDVIPFVASAVGGIMLFVLATVPLGAVLLPVAADISPRLAQVSLLALPLIACAAMPILLGRLAGAFVASELAAPEPRRSSRRTSPDMPAVPAPAPAIEAAAQPDEMSKTMGALAGLPRVSTMSVRMEMPTALGVGRSGMPQGLPLGVAVARAHQLAETDVASALEELEQLRAANPRNPAVAGEQAKVLRKAGRVEEARQAAADAIRLALTGGAGPIAHDVFRSFASEASHLNLEPSVYEQLARILTARREFEAATWCYRAAAVLGGDPRTLQKGLLGCAEAALDGEHAMQAVQAYEAFQATWPESPLAAFAAEGAETARRRAQVVPGG